MSPFLTGTVEVILGILVADCLMIAAKHLLTKGVPHQ